MHPENWACANEFLNLEQGFLVRWVMSVTYFICHEEEQNNEQTRTFSSVGAFETLNFAKYKSWCRILSWEFASSPSHVVIAQPEYQIKFAGFTIIMELGIIGLIIQSNEENLYIFINLCNLGTWWRTALWVQLGVQCWGVNRWDAAAPCFHDSPTLILLNWVRLF